MARQVATDGFYGTVAPMVERSPEEAGVGGSNPSRPTIMGIMESSVPYYNSGRETEFESRMSTIFWARSSVW